MSIARRSARRRASIVVHPAALYVGMRLKPLTDDELQVVVTDIDGNAVAGVPIDVQLEATLYSEARKDDAKIRDTQALRADQRARAGRLRARDEARLAVPVSRGRDDPRRARPHEHRRVLRPELPHARRQGRRCRSPRIATAYRAGDVAKLDVHSDTVPATAIVSFARQGVIAQRRIAARPTPVTQRRGADRGRLSRERARPDRSHRRKRDLHDDTHRRPLPAFAEASIELPIDREGSRLDDPRAADEADRPARRGGDVRGRCRARRQAGRECRGRADRRRRSGARALGQAPRRSARAVLSRGRGRRAMPSTRSTTVRDDD